MELIPEEIEEYAAGHTSGVSPLIEELERETHEKTSNPRMLTGKVEGRLLQMLVRVSGARRVVDIGTFTGYSALMMAEGLPDDGELFTFEKDPAHAEIARKYFRSSPHGRKITLVMGDARETIRSIEPDTTDFVFIDADKEGYPLYYEGGLRILRPGGLIAVDNTLWSGRVLRPEDRSSLAIARFNDALMEDGRVEHVLLTVRDGLTLIRKR
jgi:caffeoyl-CoA O-methyltransferase